MSRIMILGESRLNRALISSLAALGATVCDPTAPPIHKGRKQKQCLQCGEIHQHNNSWCSAECCRTWRSSK